MEEKIKEKSHFGFFIKLAIFIALIFARNIMKLPVSETILLLVSCLIALTSDKEELVALLVCCIPTAAAFQYKYLILLSIIIYYIKFYKDIGSPLGAIPLLLMMIWEGFHSFSEEFLIVEYLRGFAELIIVSLIILDKKKDFNYTLICRMLAISAIAMCFVVLLNLLDSTGYNFEGIFTGTYRFGVGNEDAELFGVNYNANNLGFICNLSIAGLLQLVASKKQKSIDLVMIILLMFFGFLTMSRAFIICCAFILVLFMVSKGSGVSNTIKAVISTAFVLGIVYLIVNNYAPFIVERIIKRFQVNDVSNGRTQLFAFYNEHLLYNSKNLLFGIGIQDIHSKIYKMYSGLMIDVPHNGIQELLVVWGIPGLAFFTMFVVNLIKKSNMKYKIINYIPMLMTFLYVQSGQMITSGTVLLAFLFMYASLCENFGGTLNENNRESCEVH